MKTLVLLTAVLIFGFYGCKREESITLPEVVTEPAAVLSGTMVICGGKIINAGGDSVMVKGVCWSSQHVPTVEDSVITEGSGSEDFFSIIGNLATDVRYYMRAYAANSAGTAYGEVVEVTPVSLVTSSPGTVKDAMGYEYETVQIGNQVWMKENLKTNTVNTGERYGTVHDNYWWGQQTRFAICYLDNKFFNCADYGMLYNGYAVKDTRGIAPEGWHVATIDDWMELINYAGGIEQAGRKLRKDFLYEPGTDDYGFSALPGSYRDRLPDCEFKIHYLVGRWWAIDSKSFSGLSSIEINSRDKITITEITTYSYGFSVRCVKNR